MVTNLTMADVFRPVEKARAIFYDAALIVCGTFIIAACAQLKIWLPFSPVPVTGQTFAVLMTAALLGARRASLCVLVYLAEGAAGLPVFAATGAGSAVLSGPSGGYLAGFLAAAYLTGSLAQKGWDRRLWTTVLAMVLGNMAIYAFGLAWLCRLTGGYRGIVAVGLYPFIIGDCLKITLAAILLPAGWKLLKAFQPPADGKQ